MTKIPTISEMEEFLLRDSETEDLVEAGNTKSKTPNTKLTAEQVQHEVSVFARVLINVYCGWPFHNEVLKRKILKTLIDVHKNAHDMTSAEFLEQLRPAIEIIPDNHIQLNMVGQNMGARTALRKPRPNVGKNIASGKKFHTEQRGDIGIIAVPTLSGWTDAERKIFEKQWRAILSQSKTLIIDLRDSGGGDNRPTDKIAEYILGQKYPNANKEIIRNNPDAKHVHKLYPERIGNNFDTDSLDDPFIIHDNSIKPTQKYDPKNARHTVYILTNRGVSSSAEMFIFRMKHYPKTTIVGTNTNGCEVYGYNQYILLPYTHMKFTVGAVYRELSIKDFETNGFEPDIKCADGTDAFAVTMDEIEKSNALQSPSPER
ncbi:MAG: S41 family peptidase [Alphaproteobacteria bacterium]